MALLASDFDRSKYLKASDLEEEGKFKIKSVTEETVGQGPKAEQKLVLWFVNHEQGYVCNKTALRVLGPAFGNDTSGWVGKIITIYPDITTMQGKSVPCLRVRPPKANGAAAPAKPQPTLAEELNDDLPDDLKA
jgi:hypothetical protein